MLDNFLPKTAHKNALLLFFHSIERHLVNLYSLHNVHSREGLMNVLHVKVRLQTHHTHSSHTYSLLLNLSQMVVWLQQHNDMASCCFFSKMFWRVFL